MAPIEKNYPMDNQENEDPDNVFQRLWNDNLLHRPKTGRVIYLSRHGESLNNVFGKIGGNACLSGQGERYAQALASHFNAQHASIDTLQIWHSQLVRTKQTAKSIRAPSKVFPQLNEINSGLHDNMTYEEIAEKFPKEFAQRDQDKLRYRYPRGESYVDVCRRLCEILPDLDRSDNVLVISHQAVLRCVIAYFSRSKMEALPYMKVPLHTIIKVTLLADGQNSIELTKLPIDCVDTYREKPKNCQSDRSIDEALASVPAHI